MMMFKEIALNEALRIIGEGNKEKNLYFFSGKKFNNKNNKPTEQKKKMAGSHETSWNIELDEQLLQDLYAWIDQIPLSRPKRRIERDFSDGVMVAELVKYYFPNWVELHNYAPANNTQQKMINWGLLNRKVFQRFDLNVPEHIMRGICVGKTGLIETFLYNLRVKIDE